MAVKRVVACDLDGCLVCWNTPFAKLLIKAQGEDLLPPDWERTEPEWVTCWDWPSHYGYTKISQELAWHEARESGDFWYRLPAYKEAQVVLDTLNDLVNADEIDLYFITQRSGSRAKQSTEMWLYDRGLLNPTVLVTGNKIPVLKGLGTDFFIDDRLETVIQAHRAGLSKGVYLLDRPWNRAGRHDAGCPAGDQEEGCYCSLHGLQVVETVEEALRREDLWTAQ